MNSLYHAVIKFVSTDRCEALGCGGRLNVRPVDGPGDTSLLLCRTHRDRLHRLSQAGQTGPHGRAQQVSISREGHRSRTDRTDAKAVYSP